MSKIAKITQMGPGQRTSDQVVRISGGTTVTAEPSLTDVNVDVRQAQNGVFLVRGPAGQIVTCTSALEIGNAIRSFFKLAPEGSVREQPSASKGERYQAPDGFGLGDQMLVEGASWLIGKAQQGSRSGMGSMAGLTKKMKGTSNRRKKKK